MNTKAVEDETASTKIIPCTCSNKYQDRSYGSSKRVHNRTKSGWRCTVCGKDK